MKESIRKPLGLEFQVVVSHSTCVMGLRLLSSAGTVPVLPTEHLFSFLILYTHAALDKIIGKIN